MNAQKLGTKIHTATDIEMTALLNTIDGDARLLVACELLGKNPADYNHLDKGRRSMCGSNLLRGAARKNPEMVAAARNLINGAGIFEVMDKFNTDTKHVETLLKEEDEMASFDVKGEGSIEISWPKSARFKFAQRQEDGEWKFFYNAPKSGSYFTR